MNTHKTQPKNAKIVRDEDRAMNIWLGLLDQELEQKRGLTEAMYIAGERLQLEDQKHGGELFHPTDLWVATQEINLLLRKTPDFKTRTAGWSKQQIAQSQRKVYKEDE